MAKPLQPPQNKRAGNAAVSCLQVLPPCNHVCGARRNTRFAIITSTNLFLLPYAHCATFFAILTRY